MCELNRQPQKPKDVSSPTIVSLNFGNPYARLAGLLYCEENLSEQMPEYAIRWSCQTPYSSKSPRSTKRSSPSSMEMPIESTINKLLGLFSLLLTASAIHMFKGTQDQTGPGPPE